MGTPYSYNVGKLLQHLEAAIQSSPPEKIVSAVKTKLEEAAIRSRAWETQAQILSFAAETAMRKNLQAALILIESALAVIPSEADTDPSAINVYALAGLIAGKLGHYGSAFRYLRKGIHKAAATENAPQLITQLLSLATIYFEREQFSKALSVLDTTAQALQWYRGQLSEVAANRYHARIVNNYAIIYGQRGEYFKALRALFEIPIDQIATSQDRFLLAMNTAICLENLGIFDEAFQYYQTAWKALQQSSMPDAEQEALLLINLSAAALRSNRPAAAEQYARQAYDRLVQMHSGPEHLADALSNLLAAVAQQKDQEQFFTLFPAAEEIFQQLSSLHSKAEFALNIATSSEILQADDLARCYAQQAQQIAEQSGHTEIFWEATLLLASLAFKAAHLPETVQQLQRLALQLDTHIPPELQRKLFEQYAQYQRMLGNWQEADRWAQRSYRAHIRWLEQHWAQRVEATQYQVEARLRRQQHSTLTKYQHLANQLQRWQETLQKALKQHLQTSVSETQLTVKLLHSEEPLSSPYNRELLQVIQNNLAFQTALITHLSEWLHFTSTADIPPLSRTECQQLIQKAIDSVRASAQHKQLHIQQQLQPCWLQTVPQWVERMVTELLSSAIDASPPKGTVTIVVEATDTEVLIHIADSGKAIPSSLRDQIFEPLAILKTSDASAISASFRLPIARALATRLGGTITLHSSPDGDNIFTLHLPRSGAQSRNNPS